MTVAIKFVDGSSHETAVPCPEHYEGSKNQQAEEVMVQKVFGLLGIENDES